MSESRELLNVIIPCLNERENIRSTVQSVVDIRDDLPVDVQIVMVDDGSTDETIEVMHALAEEFGGCRVLQNPHNMGLGRTVMNTWTQLPADSWATVVPGDNEIYFDSIWNFLAVRDQYDVILGYVQNPVQRTLTRRVASFAFSKTVSTLFGFPYRYLNGMKMYRVGALVGIEVSSGGHAFNAELLAKAVLRDPRIRIGEVPFVWRGRSHGVTKAFQPRQIARAVREVAQGVGHVDRYRSKILEDRG